MGWQNAAFKNQKHVATALTFYPHSVRYEEAVALYPSALQTTMASATPILSASLRLPSSSSSYSVRVSNDVVQFSSFYRACSLKLSSSRNISGFAPILPLRRSALNSPSPNQSSSLTVVSAKGYKMKTHKVYTSVSASLMQFGGFWVLLFVWFLGKDAKFLCLFTHFLSFTCIFSAVTMRHFFLFQLFLCSFVLKTGYL